MKNGLKSEIASGGSAEFMDANRTAAIYGAAHDPILSVEEAARKLRLSAYTVRQWAREGRLPAMRLGRYWRFRASSLDAWCAEQERGGR